MGSPHRSRTGILVALALLAGCERPQPRPAGFRPQDELTARGLPGDVAPLWRRRDQHTHGTAGEDLFPCASPDGRTLVFATSRFTGKFALVAMPVGGPTLTLLTDGSANDIHPAVSPDGAALAFSSDREGAWALYLLGMAPGARPRRAVTSVADTLGPAWSPDGAKLACFRRSPEHGEWHVWIVDVATGNETLVTEGLFPAWSPDGRWIAFQRPQKRDERWYSIWKVRADGGRATQITSGWRDDRGAVTPVWSPDGRWIAFTAVAGAADPSSPRPPGGETDLVLVAPDGTRVTNLTGDRPSVSEWNPRFGPDGTLFFNSDEDGGVRVWSILLGRDARAN